MDFIYDIRSEKAFSFKGLVIFTLKDINVMRPCRHSLEDGSFYHEVVPNHMYKFLWAVAELLGRGDHMDWLVQNLARLFLG